MDTWRSCVPHRLQLGMCSAGLFMRGALSGILKAWSRHCEQATRACCTDSQRSWCRRALQPRSHSNSSTARTARLRLLGPQHLDTRSPLTLAGRSPRTPGSALAQVWHLPSHTHHVTHSPPKLGFLRIRCLAVQPCHRGLPQSWAMSPLPIKGVCCCAQLRQGCLLSLPDLQPVSETGDAALSCAKEQSCEESGPIAILSRIVMLRIECAGGASSQQQTHARSVQGAYTGGAPAGAQLGGLDLMSILQNAGVQPMPQPAIKPEPAASMQVSIGFQSSATCLISLSVYAPGGQEDLGRDSEHVLWSVRCVILFPQGRKMGLDGLVYAMPQPCNLQMAC